MGRQAYLTPHSLTITMPLRQGYQLSATNGAAITSGFDMTQLYGLYRRLELKVMFHVKQSINFICLLLDVIYLFVFYFIECFVCVCAGEGGHEYLKDWLWWGGLLTSEFVLPSSEIYSQYSPEAL
uniref:Uncharacterized protein n=1 Tax=Oncorhynchus mykiss TaxID=8022 RepID=A0A8K9WWP0_ONCMY